MSQPSSFFKHKIALFLVVLMVLTACIPPRQLTQGSKNSFNSTGDFQVQNSLEEQINNLPYAPDPYGQFTVLSKSGHSPIQVITERSVPKNLQVSFEDQVNILPTQLHGHLVRGLQPSEGKLMANVYIEEFEKVFARYSSTLWAEFIKLQQKDQQKSESDHESLLNSLEKGSQAYLVAKTTYQETKKKQVETFTLQRKILREALNQAKLTQIEALRQRFDKGDFSIQGECKNGNWWEQLTCSVATTFSDFSATLAKGVVIVAQNFGMSPYAIDQFQKNIDLANEIGKNQLFSNYNVSEGYEWLESPSPPPQEKQKPAQEHKEFGMDLPAIPNASPAAKTLPEQYAEYSTPAEPSDLDPSVSKTLKFILENNPRLESKTMGAFAAPIFLSDILVGLGVPGADNFFSSSAVDCRNKRTTGTSYFTAENLGQIYNQTGDLFNTPCDIAVDSVFFSLDLQLKFMVETINQEIRKEATKNRINEQLIVQYSVEDVRRIFYSDEELSKVVKNSALINRVKALRGYYEQYLPQFTKNIEVHKNPQTGSNIIEAQLSLTDQNLKDNILAHLNFQGQDNPEDRPTTTLAWLISRVRYYRDKGIYHLSDSQIESIEQFLSNKLASRVFAFRVITPDRCDTNMVNTFRPLGNEESLQQFGSVMVSTSSENFAYDGDYTIELGYYTTNDPKPTPRTPWEAVVRLEKIPAAELMGLSVDDLMHRTDGKKFNPLSVSRFGQKSIIAAGDPIPLNTKVAVQVQNKTGNFWDVQIDKVGNPDCKPAYLAVCLPYNESTFQLNHLKYRTGVYRLSTRYSAVKTKKEYDLNWSKNWLINGVDVNKKIYGANLTGYGAPYAYEYVVLHPQYSTFTRVTEAPADIAFSTRYRDPKDFGNVFDGFSTAQYNYLGDRGDESEPALDYVPNLTAPTPQEDGLEVSNEPKAKNGLYEANFSSEAFQQQIQADYKLKKGAKNLLIDLLRPHESGYQYDIFNRTQIDARPQNSFVHVGAIISLRNGDLHNNFELWKRAHSSYSQASVPLRLILKQNDTIIQEWPIDAPIGSDTFVQRYWDGSHEQGKALNTSHPRYQEGQYSVWVTIDENRWLPATEDIYGQVFKAQVYKPIVLDGSSDVHSFNLVGNTEKEIKITHAQFENNGTFLLTGEAPGLSAQEIKTLALEFDGDLEFETGDYEVVLKENSKFEIRLHNFNYSEQFYEKYINDQSIANLRVKAKVCQVNSTTVCALSQELTPPQTELSDAPFTSDELTKIKSFVNESQDIISSYTNLNENSNEARLALLRSNYLEFNEFHLANADPTRPYYVVTAKQFSEILQRINRLNNRYHSINTHLQVIDQHGLNSQSIQAKNARKALRAHIRQRSRENLQLAKKGLINSGMLTRLIRLTGPGLAAYMSTIPHQSITGDSEFRLKAITGTLSRLGDELALLESEFNKKIKNTASQDKNSLDLNTMAKIYYDILASFIYLVEEQITILDQFDSQSFNTVNKNIRSFESKVINAPYSFFRALNRFYQACDPCIKKYSGTPSYYDSLVNADVPSRVDVSEEELKCRICQMKDERSNGQLNTEEYDRRSFEVLLNIRKGLQKFEVDILPAGSTEAKKYGVGLNSSIGDLGSQVIAFSLISLNNQNKLIVSFSGSDHIVSGTLRNPSVNIRINDEIYQKSQKIIKRKISNLLIEENALGIPIFEDDIILAQESINLNPSKPRFLSLKNIAGTSIQNDAEIKILETASRLFPNLTQINIFTDRIACEYCKDISFRINDTNVIWSLNPQGISKNLDYFEPHKLTQTKFLGKPFYTNERFNSPLIERGILFIKNIRANSKSNACKNY